MRKDVLVLDKDCWYSRMVHVERLYPNEVFFT